MRMKLIRGYKAGDPQRTIKVKRGGGSKNNNSGPSGYQMTPARRNARAWAEMAGGFGMINGHKRGPYLERQAARRKALGQDVRTGGKL